MIVGGLLMWLLPICISVMAWEDHLWISAQDNVNIYTWWSQVNLKISFGNNATGSQNNATWLSLIVNLNDIFVPWSIKVTYKWYGWNNRYTISSQKLVGYMAILPWWAWGSFDITGTVKLICPPTAKIALVSAIDVSVLNNWWWLWNMMGMINFLSQNYYVDSIEKIVKVSAIDPLLNKPNVTISGVPLQQNIYFTNKLGSFWRWSGSNNMDVMTGYCGA